MALTKITITLEPTDKATANRSAMAQTIGLLAGLLDIPAGKVVLTIACEPEDADTYRDEIRAALSRRPVGIKVNIKSLDDEDVDNERMATVTPMDSVWSNN